MIPVTLPAPVVHALLHPELGDDAFAATRFTPAATKAWFARHMVHFLASDCPRHQFTPRFHAQLTRCFNLPTHYGLRSFWTEHFATARTKARFVEKVQHHPGHGGSNPAWRDVEQEIARRLRRSGLLAHYRQRAAGEHDAADRAELARLVTKYGRDIPAPDPGILRTVLVPVNRPAPPRPARRRDDTGQPALGLG